MILMPVLLFIPKTSTLATTRFAASSVDVFCSSFFLLYLISHLQNYRPYHVYFLRISHSGAATILEPTIFSISDEALQSSTP